MAEQETIREFLVSLGFKTKEAEQKKFADSIGFATAKFMTLFHFGEKAVEFIGHAVSEFARHMEGLYYVTQRTKASAQGVENLQYAASQLGSTADAVTGSLENLGSFLRNTPGAESWINNLGVRTREANGELRKTDEVFSDIGKKLSAMSQPQAKVYADFLGIDEKTLLAMRSGEFDKFMEQRQKMSRSLDLDDITAKSKRLDDALRQLTSRFSVLGQTAYGVLLDKVLAPLDRLNQWIDTNWEKIAGLTKVFAYLITGGAKRDSKGDSDAFDDKSEDAAAARRAKIVNNMLSVTAAAPNAPVLGGIDTSVTHGASVSQQTSITVVSPDATQAGASVAREQSRVNENLARQFRTPVQ